MYTDKFSITFKFTDPPKDMIDIQPNMEAF